jgi:hypothetical protein
LVGDSDWSGAVVATTGILPSRPGLLTFEASTRTSLSLSWKKLDGDETGGSYAKPLIITFYRLYLDDG